MQRTILALVLSTTLIVAGLVVGSPSTTSPADAEAEVMALAHSGESNRQRNQDRRTTTTRVPQDSSTTTTTQPADTTTTSVAVTTTTTAPASTTTAPPTTLPSKSAGSIPATVPYTGGLDKYGGHEAIISCGASTEDFDCEQFGSNHWWDAPYLGTNLPYTTGYAWVDGDRQGYSCAYGFLQDLSTGELIGRWAALLPPGAEAYGKVNDRFMSEGVRYYDGELANEGGNELSDPNKASECYDILSDDIDYEAVNTGADERPRIGFFNGAGQIIDIRDYSNTALSSPGKFKLLAWDGNEAVVGFYPAQNNKAAVTFYYTAMGSGQLAVDFNGTGPYQP